jgi:hypothetical protein
VTDQTPTPLDEKALRETCRLALNPHWGVGDTQDYLARACLALLDERRTLREKLEAADAERKLLLDVLECAEKRIGHGEYCNCAIGSGRHGDEHCDCGNVEAEKAITKARECVGRGET